MRAEDESALICDFAQFYQISDVKSLGITYAAILACGLPAESRTMKRLTGQKLTMEETLLAMLIDTARAINYSYCKAHSKEIVRKPDSVVETLLYGPPESEVMGFGSPEEFEKYRKEKFGG